VLVCYCVATSAVGRHLLQQIESARARTDELFKLLRPDALYSRPIPERHRLIFYLGHLEAFDWNQICRNALDVSAFHPEFDHLFEFGIDPPVGKAAQDQPSDWPSENEIQTYNRRTRAIVDEVLEQAPAQIAHVALEHRLMHAETLAYLLHNLPYDQKVPVHAHAIHSIEESLEGRMIEIPSGQATLGQKPGEFGWDNEFDRHQVTVPGFTIGKYKVTNGEYLEFVRAGAKPPHFWIERNGEWIYKGMFAELPLPANAPVFVTYAEASAYARWAGKTLATEAQFRVQYANGRGESVSMGERRSRHRAREFRLPFVRSHRRHRKPGRRQRIRRFATGGKRLGVDLNAVRPVSGIRAIPVLRRLLQEFLRRRALCIERRIAADRGLFPAALFPELVSARLPLCLRQLSPRRKLTRFRTLTCGNSPPRCAPT
jgi:hypothetical protein